MSSCKVTLEDASRPISPGQSLSGEAEWELSEDVEALEVRLCWTTEAMHGSEPPVIVKAEEIDHPARRGHRHFRYDLPAGPWSFEGKLFSVEWYVELSAQTRELARASFILSPFGQPVRTRGPERESSDEMKEGIPPAGDP